MNNARPSERLVTADELIDRQTRIMCEAEGIARARASAAAGRVVSEAEMDAWIDSIGTDKELPVPNSGR